MKSLNQFLAFLQALNKKLNGERNEAFINTEDPAIQIKPLQSAHLQLNHLHLDSRQLEVADVFIALQGARCHGLDYLTQAVAAKVACILSDRVLTQTEQAWLEQQANAPQILVMTGLNRYLGALAHWYYDQPSQKLNVVGITGTNGKTSSAHYLVQLLLQLGQKPALMGTLGTGLVSSNAHLELETTFNTTPDVISVHRLLNQFYQQGANWVVMEVSSHALALGRIEQVVFEAVALTQVTRDHLDFHGTEQAYHQAKARLFTDYKSRFQVINVNDKLGQSLIKSDSLNHVFGYGLKPDNDASLFYKCASLQCASHQLNPTGIELDLVYKHQTNQAWLNLMGKFNIENVLCALSVVLACGFEWKKALGLLENLTSVNGRMQKVANAPTVIVDFAHTADALAQVLKALKQHVLSQLGQGSQNQGSQDNQTNDAAYSGKIVVVFGCGGDRDQGKRPLMAKAAEANAHQVVLTDDNPRFESTDKIMAEILKGFERPEMVVVIENRKQAIEAALNNAHKKDVVLIAGKGHEHYQDIQGMKHPFSDQKVVQDWLKRHLQKNL